MIYRNTPLSHKLLSSIHILQSQAARTQLLMSSVQDTTGIRLRTVESEQQAGTFTHT